MADSKVAALPAKATPTGTDLVYIVDVADLTDDPTGSSKKATITSLPVLPISGGTLTGNTTISTTSNPALLLTDTTGVKTFTLRDDSSGNNLIVVNPSGSVLFSISNGDEVDITNGKFSAKFNGAKALNVVGAIYTAVATKTAAYTIGTQDSTIFANATSATFAVTLPDSTSNPGMTVCIKKIDASANAVTVTAAGTDTIDGVATKSLATQYTHTTLQSDGSGHWFVLA